MEGLNILMFLYDDDDAQGVEGPEVIGALRGPNLKYKMPMPRQCEAHSTDVSRVCPNRLIAPKISIHNRLFKRLHCLLDYNKRKYTIRTTKYKMNDLQQRKR